MALHYVLNCLVYVFTLKVSGMNILPQINEYPIYVTYF